VWTDVAVTPLCTALNDTDWFVRWNAALALGLICDPRAVDPSAGLCTTRTGTCVETQPKLLEHQKQERDRPLIESLQDPDVDVRWNAADALGKLRDQNATDPLISRIE